MIKLFVTDIDGTLLPAGGRASEKNVAAVQAMVKAGVKVVIATGRMYSAALNVAAQLGVPVPIIAYNGALIKSSAGEVLHTHYMDATLVLKLLDFFTARGWHIQSYSDDILYVPKRDRYVEFYETMLNVTAVEVGWDGMREHAEGVPKLLSATDNLKETDERMNAVRENFGEQVEVTRSNPRFAEFIAPGVSKASAIKILAEKFGADISEVLAIGDSDNDLPMLKAAGTGVAMGNAVPAVKAACNYVTDTCENDGFAKAVYKFVL